MQRLTNIHKESPREGNDNRESQCFYRENLHVVEEDEINLLDLLITPLRHKKLIIAMVILAGMAASIISVLRSETKSFQSEAIIVPAQGGIASFGMTGRNYYGGAQYSIGKSSAEKLLMLLDSRALTAQVIEKYNLMPVLFSESWDSESKKWKGDPPSLHNACEKLKAMLNTGRVNEPGRSNRYRSYGSGEVPVFVSIRFHIPETAKEIVDYYLKELSHSLREEALRDATEKQRFLEKQLEKTLDPLMLEKIHLLRAQEIEKETFAKAKKYYGFTVMDPPVVPDRLSAKKPKYKRNVLLAVTVAFFMGIFLSFVIEYVRRVKAEDSERFQELIRELKTWRNK